MNNFDQVVKTTVKMAELSFVMQKISVLDFSVVKLPPYVRRQVMHTLLPSDSSLNSEEFHHKT